MPRKIILATLVDRCRRRFAAEGDTQIEDAEIQEWISELVGELHTTVDEKGARYFESEATIVTTGDVRQPLPDDHLSTIGVDAMVNGETGPRRPLHGPLPVQYRSRVIGRTGPACYWAHEGTDLALYPVPAAGLVYRHLYVPQPPDLSTAPLNTAVDLIDIWGEKMVLWGVASIGQHKGSTSQVRAVDECQRAREQVEYWACQRALVASTSRVVDDFDWDELFCRHHDWRL